MLLIKNDLWTQMTGTSKLNRFRQGEGILCRGFDAVHRQKHLCKVCRVIHPPLSSCLAGDSDPSGLRDASRLAQIIFNPCQVHRLMFDVCMKVG